MTGDLGARLRELRRGRGLTQEQLAGKAGVSWNLISLLERGARDSARLSTLALLADALGVQVRELLGPAEPEPPAAADPFGARICKLLRRRGMSPGELEMLLASGQRLAASPQRVTLTQQVAVLAAEVRALRAEVRALARPKPEPD